MINSIKIYYRQATGNGSYSGTGYVIVPYLADTRLKVTFSNIQINTDRQLINGYLETTYDATEKNIVGLNNNQNNIAADTITNPATLAYALPDSPKITYNEQDETLTLQDAAGNSHTLVLPKDSTGNVTFPITVTDQNGNTYQISKDDSGQVAVNNIENVEIADAAAKNATIQFKIDKNIYTNDQTFATMYINKKLRIEILPTNDNDSISWEDLDISVQKKGSGSGSYEVDLQKDSSQVNGATVVTRFVEILASKDSLNANNSLVVKSKTANKQMADLKIATYYAPIVKFDMGDNYDGSYFFDKGFDEQTSLKKSITEDIGYYQVFKVGKNQEDYYTPVLGLTVGSQATIKVNLSDFDSKINSDSTFKIIIKAEANGIVRLNRNNDSIILNKTQLQQIKNSGLTIESLEAINRTDLTPVLIDVLVQSTREKIGQLEYYSADKANLQVTLIYVKFSNENNFPNYIQPNTLQTYFNTKSLNQLFTNFTVDSIHENTSFRKADLSGYSSSTDIFYSLNSDIYNNTMPVIYNGNHDYFFITNLDIQLTDGKYLGGSHLSNKTGGIGVINHSVIGETNEELIAHEMGHWLNLPHTFQSNGIIPVINSTEGGTKNNGDNFMDYNLLRKRWFKIQLLNATRNK